MESIRKEKVSKAAMYIWNDNHKESYVFDNACIAIELAKNNVSEKFNVHVVCEGKTVFIRRIEK